ncbi:MAG: hypothetical protein LAQ69_10455 [Acidobacteriia bacterium]|nr:hypothetical protein [Terriglobia bacterium]
MRSSILVGVARRADVNALAAPRSARAWDAPNCNRLPAPLGSEDGAAVDSVARSHDWPARQRS